MKAQIIKGKILHTIDSGIHAFTEIEEKSGLGSPTVSKYLRELEREGLIVVELDRFTRKPRYKINEACREEVNKLIEAYLKSEGKELVEKIDSPVMRYFELTEEEIKQLEKIKEKIKKKLVYETCGYQKRL